MIQKSTILKALPNVLKTVDVPNLGPKYQGKVRDFYVHNGQRILITTDRQSAFDVILGEIPFKGAVLNQLAAFWFSKTKRIIPNHMISVPDPNVLIAHDCQPIPIEMIVRGYISGVTKTSIWYSYSHGERFIYGQKFPDGLRKNQKLEKPVITPTTHGGGAGGHDERLTKREILERKIVSKKLYEQMEETALALFEFGSKLCKEKGLILVDTKYEFGLYDGKLMLIDEIHTPDSSRFWKAETYKERIASGQEPENFDKEFLRLWYADKGYTGDGQPPKMSKELIAELAQRYIKIYELVSGKEFHAFQYPIEKRILRAIEAPAHNTRPPKYAVKGVWVITEPLWGDSGKGKFSEFFGQQADMVVRYSGGDNAGHTVNLDNQEFKLHLIPGGIFNPKALCVLASGVVINPFSLAKEIEQLQAHGVKISAKNLLISEDAHMILPWHQLRDGMSEKARGGEKIGTTGKGIGPTYSDRTAREGLRIKDLLDVHFSEKFLREAQWQEKLIRLMDGESSDSKKTYFDAEKTLKELKKIAKFLQPMIGNSFEIIQQYHAHKKRIVGEGAQGALLDIDLGSYPYVTSSHPGVVGFTAVTGIHQKEVQKVIGVVKAYSTRVGGGPMPTELNDEIGKHLQTVGREVGTTTGRSRRCGWLDGVAAKYGCRVAGVDSLIVTKIDILDSSAEIKICVGYSVDGKTYHELPTADPKWLAKAKPMYETLPGWQQDTSTLRRFADLPKNAKRYLRRIEEIIGLPVEVVSVGPEHRQTLIK